MTTLKFIIAAFLASVAVLSAEHVLTAETEIVTATKIVEVGNLPHQVIETSRGGAYRINTYTQRTREVGEAVHYSEHECGFDMSCILGLLTMIVSFCLGVGAIALTSSAVADVSDPV